MGRKKYWTKLNSLWTHCINNHHWEEYKIWLMSITDEIIQDEDFQKWFANITDDVMEMKN